MKKTIISLLTLGVVSSAQAALVINIYESGGDVVVVANGNVNLTDFTGSTGGTLFNANMNPVQGRITVGASGTLTAYTGLTSAPGSFGTFDVGWTASSSIGDIIGVNQTSISVPDGYVSMAALSSTATYASHSFASLGLTEGTYTWTWGSGGDADSATMNIGAIPEPSSVVLLGLAGGFGLLRRRRK